MRQTKNSLWVRHLGRESMTHCLLFNIFFSAVCIPATGDDIADVLTWLRQTDPKNCHYLTGDACKWCLASSGTLATDSFKTGRKMYCHKDIQCLNNKLCGLLILVLKNDWPFPDVHVKIYPLPFLGGLCIGFVHPIRSLSWCVIFGQIDRLFHPWKRIIIKESFWGMVQRWWMWGRLWVPHKYIGFNRMSRRITCSVQQWCGRISISDTFVMGFCGVELVLRQQGTAAGVCWQMCSFHKEKCPWNLALQRIVDVWACPVKTIIAFSYRVPGDRPPSWYTQWWQLLSKVSVYCRN